jgi:hypothetical protein
VWTVGDVDMLGGEERTGNAVWSENGGEEDGKAGQAGLQVRQIARKPPLGDVVVARPTRLDFTAGGWTEFNPTVGWFPQWALR